MAAVATPGVLAEVMELALVPAMAAGSVMVDSVVATSVVDTWVAASAEPPASRADSATFPVPIINDSIVESLYESVNLTLSNAGGGGTLGALVDAVLQIKDDEPRLSATGYSLLTAKKPRNTFTGVVAAFTSADFSTAASFASSINWGDGATSAGQIVWNSATQRWDIYGTHQYSKKGTYSLLIVITDSNGASTKAQSSMIV